jgi:hypothetical protein
VGHRAEPPDTVGVCYFAAVATSEHDVDNLRARIVVSTDVTNPDAVTYFVNGPADACAILRAWMAAMCERSC